MATAASDIDNPGKNIIRRISPAGVVSDVGGMPLSANAADSGGVGSAPVVFLPAGLAASRSGEIYVADSGSHVIRIISPTGVIETLAGVAGSAGYSDGKSTVAQFSSPLDVVVDAGGNIYVADTGNRVIRKITPTGMVTTIAGQSGRSGYQDGPADRAQFELMSSITLDAAGNIYVTDLTRIRKLSRAGQVSTIITYDATTRLRDAVIDGSGNIYASDTNRHVIYKITPAGASTIIASSAFFLPNRLTLDNAGNLLVTDFQGCGIGQVQPDGTISLLDGTYLVYGRSGGLGANSQFAGTAGIAMDVSGNLYVACNWGSSARSTKNPGR